MQSISYTRPSLARNPRSVCGQRTNAQRGCHAGQILTTPSATTALVALLASPRWRNLPKPHSFVTTAQTCSTRGRTAHFRRFRFRSSPCGRTAGLDPLTSSSLRIGHPSSNTFPLRCISIPAKPRCAELSISAPSLPSRAAKAKLALDDPRPKHSLHAQGPGEHCRAWESTVRLRRNSRPK